MKKQITGQFSSYSKTLYLVINDFNEFCPLGPT